MALWPEFSISASDDPEDLDFTQHRQELKEIKTAPDMEMDEEDEAIPLLPKVFDNKVWLNWGIELNYEYIDVKDVEDEYSGSISNFFIGTAELVVIALFNDWSRGKVVVNSEDLGREGEQAKICLDEAIVTLKRRPVPVYAVIGKTVMPFGVFEDRLIEGTLTEDLYEVEEWGATLGVSPEFYGLDISFSVYRYPQVIENLEDFTDQDFGYDHQNENRYRSYIANVTVEPIEDILSLSAFYDSEPGDGQRNLSMGGALTLYFWRLILDVEYIAALQREKDENGEEHNESAGIVGIAFNVLDPLQIASRYAVFDDDHPGNQDGVLEYRMAAGFNYAIGDWLDLSYVNDVLFSFEYRYSKFEKESGSDAADSQNEFQLQLSLAF